VNYLNLNKAQCKWIYCRNEEAKRRELLEEEFKQIDHDGSGGVSEHELLRFLNSKVRPVLNKSGGEYDPNMARVLFTRIDKNRDGTITM
jgi:Ca2+-binding EF-hand superfamily protein